MGPSSGISSKTHCTMNGLLYHRGTSQFLVYNALKRHHNEKTNLPLSASLANVCLGCTLHLIYIGLLKINTLSSSKISMVAVIANKNYL